MSKLYYCHRLNRLLVTFTADLAKTVKNVFIITQVIIEIRLHWLVEDWVICRFRLPNLQVHEQYIWRPGTLAHAKNETKDTVTCIAVPQIISFPVMVRSVIGGSDRGRDIV